MSVVTKAFPKEKGLFWPCVLSRGSLEISHQSKSQIQFTIQLTALWVCDISSGSKAGSTSRWQRHSASIANSQVSASPSDPPLSSVSWHLETWPFSLCLLYQDARTVRHSKLQHSVLQTLRSGSHRQMGKPTQSQRQHTRLSVWSDPRGSWGKAWVFMEG